MTVQVEKAKNLLIGGIVSREILAELEHLAPLSSTLYLQHAADGKVLFLIARGNSVMYREGNEYVLLVIGHIAYPQKELVALEALKEIGKHYRAHTRFPINRLEGSFTLVLLDKIKNTIVIYRNIVGFPAIYYSQTRGNTIFSDSLSVLAQINGVLYQGLKMNSEQLSTYFMYGVGQARETLFSGISLTMPGEQILFGKGHFTRSQLQTFAHMITPSLDNCAQSLEKTIQIIINEYAETHPRLGSFFSGGVDSSYLQVHLARKLNNDVKTFSADLIHPSWKIEREYARSGSEFFKSHHTFVEVHPSMYPNLLIEATATLGHPPSDGQVALVSMLSKTAAEDSSVCLCGMCADVLFGTGSCQQIDIANLAAKLMPLGSFRRQISKIFNSIRGKGSLFSDALGTMQKSLQLELEDDLSPFHPLNVPFHGMRAFTLMLDIFGSKEVEKVMSRRRGLLNQYQATETLKERLHALYLLGCTQTCEEFYQLASNNGLNLIFPFLDSRIVRTVFSMRAQYRFPFLRTKKVIKDALSMHLPRGLVQRKKTGWGLPLFEWLSPGGILSPLVEEVSEYPFLRNRMSAAKKTSGMFLWKLLTFDLWHKTFIEREFN